MRQPPDDFPPPIPAELDQGVLERFLAGESTADEIAAVEGWVTERPKHRLLLQAFARVLVTQERDRDRNAAWARVEAQTAEAEPVESAAQPEVAHPYRIAMRSRPVAWWSAIAAIVVVGLALTVSVGPKGIHAPGASTGREYTTVPGQRLVVTLSDGTRVMLGAASRLRVPAGYGRIARTTELDGEGYFDVIHDARHPFAVQVRGVVARDVGTAFDVRAYSDDPNVRIAVTSGQVAVGLALDQLGLTRPSFTTRNPPSLQDIALSAGDMVTVDATGFVVTHLANVAAATAWMQGELIFKDTPLRDAVRDVGRTFGVEITVADSTLALKRVTGKFVGQSLDVVMDVITQVVGARYEQNGQRVVIRPGSSGARGPEHGSPPPLTTVQAKATHA